MELSNRLISNQTIDAIISIKKEVIQNFEFKNLLADFAQTKAHKINFI